MKVPKWLRRDRSSRRSSDSQATPLASPNFDTSSLHDNNISRTSNIEDASSEQYKKTIITEEYTKAYSDFVNRRSLGPNITLNAQKKDDLSKSQTTPESCDRHTITKKKSYSDQRPKRSSLPTSNSHRSEFNSARVPQIKFLFSGQIFMPGSGMGFQTDKSNTDDALDVNDSCYVSTSPDLLPPRFLRGNKQIDFDDCDSPASPPNDFYKDNSLPYINHSMKSNNATLEEFARCDSVETEKMDVSEISDVDTANDSCSSVVRKLEQMCEINHKSSSFRYFRCVPLVKASALQYDEDDDAFNINNKYWQRGSWMCVPIVIKKNLKTWCPHGIKAPLDDFIGKDIEILTQLRHPNFWLLLGLCYDQSNIQSFYEESTGTLYDNIHEKKNVLSCQRSLRYLSGIASALLYLRVNKYVHSAVSSRTIMITSRDVAKLFNFELACRITSESSTYDPYKLHYSSDPEYENLKDFNTYTKVECEAQDVKSRSLFAPYRWQAPEQFDESAGLVYACKKTDVYSLCLVLWECLNNSPPWKTLSYDQLSELYFTFKTGIRLPKDGSYPPSVFDILSGGLAIKPYQRQEISIISEKFRDALIILENADDIFINKPTINNNTIIIDTEKKKSGLFKIKKKDIPMVKVTNLDEDNNNSYNEFYTPAKQFYPEFYMTQRKSSCVDLSNLPIMSSAENLSDIFSIDQDLHNSNSTEYCTIATPESKKFQNSNTTFLSPKLHSDEDSFDKSMYTTPERSRQINDMITPKSYKSLDIESLPIDRINDIINFTKGIEEKKSVTRCVFEVENENLPNPKLPIARKTKIRRNAWLSGENTEDIIKPSTDDNLLLDLTKKIKSTRKNNINNHIVDRSKRRHSLINIKYDPNANTDTLHSSKSSSNGTSPYMDDPFPNIGLFRARSQSWSTKSNNNLNKVQDDVTGVDIKPLISIHEQWIKDARKHTYKYVSLPDNFGFVDRIQNKMFQDIDLIISSGAVKPASHFEMPKDIKANSAPTITEHRNENFYEKSLWHREKNRCAVKTDNYPKSCSTPYKSESSEPIKNLIDKFTKVEDRDTHKKGFDSNFYNTVTKSRSKSKSNSESNKDQTFELAKSSILAELVDTFDKNGKLNCNKIIDLNDDHIYDTVQSDDVRDSNHNPMELNKKNKYKESNIDEDDDSITNKALKRCQAFSALQDARSTEDMYIDDEFNAQIDIHNLGSNIQLQSNAHESDCNKGNDCCLIQIKKEFKCDNIILYCESFEAATRKNNSPCESDEDDLIDLGTINALPVIEERSEDESSEAEVPPINDDKNSESANGVQDLISMYENTKDEGSSNYEAIDFIILNNKNMEYKTTESIIDDFIQV